MLTKDYLFDISTVIIQYMLTSALKKLWILGNAVMMRCLYGKYEVAAAG